MAKKKEVDKKLEELKKELGTKKIVIGTKRVLKNMKLGKIAKVFLSSNCSDGVRDDIDYYGKFAKVKILELDYPNDELGLLCKKPFSISVAGVLK